MNNWVNKNKQQCLSLPPLYSKNYWTPLADEVEQSDNSQKLLSLSQTPHTNHVRFTLPHGHIDRNSSAYRRQQRSLADTTWINPHYAAKLKLHLTNTRTHTLQQGVLNGLVPLAVSDTGATSHALLTTAPSIPTGTRSHVVFHLLNGATAPATSINKLHHDVREPARSANVVPALTENSLLSTSKFVDAGYTIVYDKNEVNYYETASTKGSSIRSRHPTGMALPTRQNLARATSPDHRKHQHGHHPTRCPNGLR